MTDKEKAVKDAHRYADKAIAVARKRTSFLRSKFKHWSNSEWRMVTKGEALSVAAIILLLLFAG
ncbi:hypothetical protein N9X40_03145 [bacterium]|nr:hypothetical protein [bacterium]